MKGEEPSECDVYSTIFPKAARSLKHGRGLVVGGGSNEKLSLALSALHDATVENRALRGVVESLALTQQSLIQRSDGLELKYTQLMTLLQGGHNHTQYLHEEDVGNNGKEQRSAEDNNNIGTNEEQDSAEDDQMVDYVTVRKNESQSKSKKRRISQNLPLLNDGKQDPQVSHKEKPSYMQVVVH